MRNLLLFLALLPLSFKTSFGQLHSPDIVRDAIAVNGLHVGTKYKQSEFVGKLGKSPTKIVGPSPEDEFPDAYAIYYGEDEFSYIDGEFYGFAIRTPAFAVNNLVRVGDSIAIVDALGGIREPWQDGDVRLVEWRPSREGLYALVSVWFYYDETGIITKMLCFINVL